MQVLIPVFAFILAVIIVLLIVIPSTADVDRLHTQTVQEKASEEQENAERVSAGAENNTATESTDSTINDFFQQYYRAMADGDVTQMDAMFDQEGYAVTSSALDSLIDSFENIRVYTAPGLKENEIAAFVYSDVKFANIDTSAPSVESFYLTKESGEPKIMTSMYSDAYIAEYLTLLSEKAPIKSIMDNTEYWLATTLKTDTGLKEIYDKMQDYIAGRE